MVLHRNVCVGKWKWFVGMMVLLMCGGPAAAQDDPLPALKLGVRSDCPPFSYRVDNDPQKGGASPEYGGYSVDLCMEIARDALAFMHYEKIEFREVLAQDRFWKLHEGDIDILCEATTVTQERMRRFAPTIYTFISGASLMYSPDLKEEGKIRVGVLRGTTTERGIRTILDRQTDIDRSRTRSFSVIRDALKHMECLDRFLNDDIDLYIADREILLSLRRMAYEKKTLRLIVSKSYYTVEPYALFLRTENHQLRYIANRTLSDIFKEDIHRIFRKNFPNKRMNDSLRQLFRLQQLLRGSDPLAGSKPSSVDARGSQ